MIEHRRKRRWLAAAIAVAGTAGAAHAQVPPEFLGTWSSNPPRCQQVNGETDVLTVTKTGFDFYEIGCELKQPTRLPTGVRFAARCSKGGIPESAGTAFLRRVGADRIDVRLAGFTWWGAGFSAEFRRCRAG